VSKILKISSLNHRKTKGAALILFFLMTLLIVSSFTISHLNQSKENVLQNKISDNQHNARILAEAKAALLGFAVSYAETHLGQPVGYLPCPNTTDSNNVDDQRCAGIAGVGKATSGSTSLCVDSCKGKEINVIGCLPWKTLGIPRLQDSSGNDLWYAVSGTYKDKQKLGLTTDTNGMFQIYDQNTNVTVGNTEDKRAIAIIFIPNQATNGQTRGSLDCSKPENYLDTLNGIDNAKGTKSGAIANSVGSENLPTKLPSTFINSPKTNTFNDQMIWITPDDYMPIYEKMNQWVAKRVQHCLNLYAGVNNDRLPWTTTLNTTDYKDVLNQKIGHIPFGNSTDTPIILLSNTTMTNITMNSEWYKDTWMGETYKKIYNKDLKLSDNCINKTLACKCFENDLNDDDGYWGNWWVNWKEKIFIILNSKNTPDISQTTNSGLTLDNQAAKFVFLIQKKKNTADDNNLITFKKLAAENPPVSSEAFSTKKEDSSNSILCSDQSCL